MTGAPIADPGAGRLSGWLRGNSVDPELAIIAGSGMTGLSACMSIRARAPLSSLLDLDVPTVSGHSGELLAGSVAGVPSLLFLGRLHLYQGLNAWDVAATVRSLMGTRVKTLVVLNAAGGLNPEFDVGDIMLIVDHINMPGLSGTSPLIPPPAGQVRFLPMRGAYSPKLQELMRTSASAIGVALKQGVYAMVAGPTYETDAELRLLRNVGADAVGMSTVPEVVMARWVGIDVAGLSVITNRAIPGETTLPSHEDVLRASNSAIDRLVNLLARFAELLAR